MRPCIILGTLCCALAPTTLLADVTLWYNGDPVASRAGESLGHGFLGDVLVYQQFDLSSAATLTGLFVNYSTAPSALNAVWEIRQGMSAGNGGTLVASGTGSGTTTFSGFNHPSAYRPSDSSTWGVRFDLNGLDVDLLPGTYWMSLSPQSTYTGGYETTGSNAVGTPAGNGAAYSYAPNFGRNYIAFPNYSYGVVGTVTAVPEASPALLLGTVSLIAATSALVRRASRLPCPEVRS